MAGVQAVSGLAVVLLSLSGAITEEPYSILAPMAGGGLLVDGGRDLWALRSRRQGEQPK